MKKHINRIAASAAALILCLTLAGCSLGGETRNYTVTIAETASTATYSSAAEMLERVRPAVVDVTSVTETGAFAGSGVIIGGAQADEGAESDRYFIITNHHVIEGGVSFSVDVLTIAADGSESTTAYAATLVGGSLKRDIAVLSIRPPAGTKFTCATFIADSDTVKVGTEVFAIGNPLGILGGTVTHGIVSATKRAVALDEIGTMTLMQTDTAINGGNSGGGLFDAAGNLVGIINSGYDTYNGQTVEGLNFAIPANDAKFAAESLIGTYEEQGGKVTRYGYVEGDARVDVTFSTATLYSSSALSSRGTYLVAAASSNASPLYSEWGSGAKAVFSITVNGVTTDLSGSGSSSYALTELANSSVAGIKAGDSVVIGYRNVLTRTSGFGGFGGLTYNYLDGTLREVSFTAQQYVYEP